ncbi:hypothetical protein GCM10011574_32780 [Microbispora bryophytorum]|uniref:Uncharacterized protein n=1 Tax=Microbispora bryophytorum TaxID=1460882 RepID=A0A8H9H2Q2_9ACTN|nr:hypothetical protein GCM10011574_32780 [Microbispora bryophytorum]
MRHVCADFPLRERHTAHRDRGCVVIDGGAADLNNALAGSHINALPATAGIDAALAAA